jgi:hydroxylaminobenzene mutase
VVASEHVGLSNVRQGAAYMVVGLLWGGVLEKTPFPGLALTAHIQLVAQGLLFLVAGLVIQRFGLGSGHASRVVLVGTPWLTWPVVLSEMANAWWGTRETLPIAARQAGATGGAQWQEQIVAAAHFVGALVMLAYWVVILGGLFARPKAAPPER